MKLFWAPLYLKWIVEVHCPDRNMYHIQGPLNWVFNDYFMMVVWLVARDRSPHGFQTMIKASVSKDWLYSPVIYKAALDVGSKLSTYYISNDFGGVSGYSQMHVSLWLNCENFDGWPGTSYRTSGCVPSYLCLFCLCHSIGLVWENLSLRLSQQWVVVYNQAPRQKSPFPRPLLKIKHNASARVLLDLLHNYLLHHDVKRRSLWSSIGITSNYISMLTSMLYVSPTRSHASCFQ